MMNGLERNEKKEQHPVSYKELEAKYGPNNPIISLGTQWDMMKRSYPQDDLTQSEKDLILYSGYQWAKWATIGITAFHLPTEMYQYALERRYVHKTRQKVLQATSVARNYGGTIDFYTVYQSSAQRIFRWGCLGMLAGSFSASMKIFLRDSDAALDEYIEQLSEPRQIWAQEVRMLQKNMQFGFCSGLCLGLLRFSKLAPLSSALLRPDSLSSSSKALRFVMDGWRGALLAIPLTFLTSFSTHIAQKVGFLIN